MAFVGGLMGPYMRPIPVGASAAMIFSLVVAFIVTPWASIRMIKHEETTSAGEHGEEDWSTRLYRKIMTPLIENGFWRWVFLISVVVLLMVSCAMVGIGWVRVKMLPFDNKSEFQVIIDMPECATLEETSNVAMEMGDYLKTVNEVTDYQLYVGTSAPFNFNGLVRHYYLRSSAHQADIQVNLAEKGHRKNQSHDIAKRVRPALKSIADRYHARVKVAEVPPGPPVLSTLVAEIYGPNYHRQKQIAADIMEIFEKTPGVVDVDWYMEENQPRYKIDVDSEKAALHGISVDRINRTLELALKGQQEGLLHQPREKEDVPIMIRLPLSARAGIQRLKQLKLLSGDGRLVPISSLINVHSIAVDQSIYHKNLMPVVYVTGDVAGVKESPVYAILEMK
ncbi:MAG: efflux RND transporter permease subunit, partial [Desulfobacterales bacterium]